MAVTAEDIADRLGRSLASDAETKQVELWIQDAEKRIRIRAQRMGVAVDPEMQDWVVALAVTAMARNPNDETQVSVAADGFRTDRRYSSSQGEVTITDAWWDELGLTKRRGAFTVRPAGSAGFSDR